MFSCTEDDGTIKPDGNISYIETGAHWNECPNQSWDGVYTHDCYPPERNCVVVCAPKKNSGDALEYNSHVLDGTIADYYESGAGQTFLPLRVDIYESLLNGEITIVNVPAGTTSDVIKYAVIPL